MSLHDVKIFKKHKILKYNIKYYFWKKNWFMPNDAAYAQIEFIKKCLRKGEKRAIILGKFGKKWTKVSTTTFGRRMDTAKSEVRAEQEAIKEGVKESIKKDIEDRKIEILNAIQRQEILSQIARGEIPLKKPMVVDKEIREIDVVPDWNDRKAAIAELNNMDGAYVNKAPVGPDGSVVPQNTTVVIKTASGTIEYPAS